MEEIVAANGPARDGDHFLQLLQEEHEKLERLVTEAEGELAGDGSLSEEVSGEFRVAAGQAKLLMRKKFHQFEALCRRNLERSPGEQFAVTGEDLAGYWDVVMMQVAQIHHIFEQSCQLMRTKCRKLH